MPTTTNPHRGCVRLADALRLLFRFEQEQRDHQRAQLANSMAVGRLCEQNRKQAVELRKLRQLAIVNELALTPSRGLL